MKQQTKVPPRDRSSPWSVKTGHIKPGSTTTFPTSEESADSGRLTFPDRCLIMTSGSTVEQVQMPRFADSNATARSKDSLVRAQGSTFFVVLAMLLLLGLGFVTAGCVKVLDLSSPEKTVAEWHAAMEAKNVGRMQNCIAVSSRQVLNVDFQGIDTVRVVSLDVEVLSQTDTDALVHVVADIETTKWSGEVTANHSDSRWSLINKGGRKWLVTSFQA